MNLYLGEYEEQQPYNLQEKESQEQSSDLLYYEFDQSAQFDHDQLHTFDGYLQEEPVLLFNCVEDVPSKNKKNIQKKSRKIKKIDSETDSQSIKRVKPKISSQDVQQLKQCKLFKTIISQMEALLHQTKTQILNEYMKKHTQ